ncbi:hypothetical protein ABZS96_27735 [Streptomyces avermitilis]|uniref:hypothetical protein n=1 Tax=Streptomyces avermitilis TaxID=33903 RepID=UPI0033BC2142
MPQMKQHLSCQQEWTPVAALRNLRAARGPLSQMDRQLAFEAQLNPEAMHIEANPYALLEAARRENLGQVVAQLQSRGRCPRACLYALSVGGQAPRHSLNAAAAFAEHQSWQVGANQSYTDDQGATDSLARPGWRLVRQQVRAGYVDGVVVVTRSVISSRTDEYREQLAWFEQHFAFVGVVVPEVQKVQR